MVKVTEKLKARCLVAYLESLPLDRTTQVAIEEIDQLASNAIDEVIAEEQVSDLPAIVEALTLWLQPECDEILVRDEDHQAITKIIEVALDKFLANNDLGGADEATVDRIVSLVWDNMDDVAKDWCLDAYTCLESVIDDLIEETTKRTKWQIDAILAGEYLDEDYEEDCDA